MRSLYLLVLVLALSVGLAAGGAPQNMSIQGRMTDAGGSPITGTRSVTFRLYGVATGGTPVWTEDQTVDFDVAGRFNVILGNTIALAVPFDRAYWLGLTVAGDSEMMPRTELTGAPYALHAVSVRDSAVSESTIANGSVVRSVNGLRDYVILQAGSNVSISSNGNTLTISATGGGGAGDGYSLDAADGSPTDAVYVDAEGRVGIGTTTPAAAAKLHSMGRLFLQGNTIDDGLVIGSNLFPDKGAHLTWQSDQGLSIHSWGRAFGQQLFIDGDTSNIGIGTSSPQKKLHIADPTYAYLTLETTATSGGRYAGIQFISPVSGSPAEQGFLRFDDDSHMFHWEVKDHDLNITRPGGSLAYTNSGDLTLLGGRIVEYKSIPSQTDPSQGLMLLHNSSTNSTAHATACVATMGASAGDPFFSCVVSAEAGWSLGLDNSDANKFKISNQWDNLASGAKMTITPDGNVGIGTTAPTSTLDVKGNITLRSAATNSVIIELGEGLDYAEGFEVLDHPGVEPGAVLSIDPESPGKLALSACAYDTRVAGIVAGANGLGSGVRLGGSGFDFDVALAGRVYCNVDASEVGIEPGDLLTTSSTPGFAMKATDHRLSSGAILGKAMERLAKGTRGRILVLVSLQ